MDADQIKKHISIRDFKRTTVTGTTSSTANTSAKFRHGLSQLPIFWVIQEGPVYVASNGCDQNQIDVRSAQTSQTFKIILFY